MHARIDALTRPRFWSLLPSTILDWVVIIVSVFPSVDAPKRADTSRERYLKYFVRRPHRTDLLFVGAREHYSGCTSLHLRKRITTGVAHHPPTWHTSHICLNVKPFVYFSYTLGVFIWILFFFFRTYCKDCHKKFFQDSQAVNALLYF